MSFQREQDKLVQIKSQVPIYLSTTKSPPKPLKQIPSVSYKTESPL